MRARDALINSYAPTYALGHRARFLQLLEEAEANARAKALADVVTWLVKKARECRAGGTRQDRAQADTAAVLASQIERGAIRPNNQRMLPEPGFFEHGRAYRRTSSDGEVWEFQVVAVDRDPANTLQAIGWLGRVGSTIWHPSCRGTVAWVSEGWTDVTEEVAS